MSSWGNAEDRADGNDDFIDMSAHQRRMNETMNSVYETVARQRIREANIQTYGEACLRILENENGQGELFGGLYIERRIQ